MNGFKRMTVGMAASGLLVACAPLAPNARPTAGPAPGPAAAAPATGTATATAATPPAPTAAAAGGPAALAVSATPPAPVPFEDAVARAADNLFAQGVKNLGLEPGKPPRRLVIDPLIDASTGQQTSGTQKMGQMLAERVGARHSDAFAVTPFTREALDQAPVLLIGTLTAVNKDNNPRLQNDVYRIWLTLIDLRTGKIVAKALDRATEDSVDATPTAFHQEAPTWSKDVTVEAYINSCQATTKVGDYAHPMYLMRLLTAAQVNEALIAYQQGRIEEAFRLYYDAAISAGNNNLRVLNGLYLTAWKLNHRREAAEAFGKIVNLGLRDKRLRVKFLFEPSAATFINLRDLSSQYDMWLGQIARQAAVAPACLRVVGHTSKTGSPTANEALSFKRALAVRNRLVGEITPLRARIAARGAGANETLVGTGTDDLRDALDRRVEFDVIECPAA